MTTITEVIQHDHAYLIPLGDIHLEDKAFTKKSEEKLRGYVDWIRKNPNSRVFLTGDIFNVATRISKTSVFEVNTRLLSDYDGDQMAYAINIFEPIKSQIIGAIDGNHEFRTRDFNNRSWLTELCGKLSTKEHEVKYCKDSCMLFLKVGKSNKIGINRSKETYSGYIHHTTGGGKTPGSKINRVDDLRKIIAGCDFYIGGHNHMIGGVKPKIYVPNVNNCTLTEINQIEIDSGGFLEFDSSYAERQELSPMEIGAPKIRFDGKEKSIIVSL